jgi:hypothetical protein
MQLPDLELDLKVFREQLAAVLRAPDTHIFIDTSVMIWLYRLGASARDNFVNWVSDSNYKPRVHIPVWAMHEFLGKVQDGANNVFFPHASAVKALGGVEEKIKSAVSLLIDEQLLKQHHIAKTRESYLLRIDRIFRILNAAVSPLKAKFSAEEIHQTLFPLFNELALKSDIFKDLSDLRRGYLARSEGRVPPGFEDQRKAKLTDQFDVSGELLHAGANRFGDLVFWEEAVTYCKTAKAKCCVVLSNDVKRDWIYQPNKYKDLDGRVKSNNSGNSLSRVYVASPLLKHEIELRAGTKDLFVISAFQLVPILVQQLALPIDDLARAVQVDFAATTVVSELAVQLDVKSESIDSTESVAEPVPSSTGEAHAGLHVKMIAGSSITVSALADKDYGGGPDRQVDAVIADLKSHNWYVQNPAIDRARKILPQSSASPDQIFVLGRNFYQAACGGANEARNYIQNLWIETVLLSDASANILVAGMFCEAYFGPRGSVRPKPKSGALRFLLAVQSNSRFKAAIDFINDALKPLDTRFLLLPAAPPHHRKLSLEIVTHGNSRELTGISVEGHPLTTMMAQSGFFDSVSSSAHPREISLKQILNKLADHFSVLPEQLVTGEDDESIFVVSPQLNFVVWGTDTNTELS